MQLSFSAVAVVVRANVVKRPVSWYVDFMVDGLSWLMSELLMLGIAVCVSGSFCRDCRNVSE